MNSAQTKLQIAAIRVSTGQPVDWKDALSEVWSGVSPPEALILQVIWPPDLYDVVDQNPHTIG